MPTNRAAYLVSAKAKPFEIKESQYVSPSENQILVKNAALAINPIDWKLQDMALYPLQYPAILGQDCAGEVVEVGPGVTRFKVGDRVVGHAVGMFAKLKTECGFQEYSIILAHMASPIPNSISYEQACVIPLGLSTASCGLYQEDFLNLQLPSVNAKSVGQTVLIWGGASSVGSNAIQAVVNSGYEVFTTASSKNFDHVKKLGASQAFDYNHKNVVEEILSALKGKTLAGVLDCINTNGAFQACADIAAKAEGSHRISTVGMIPDDVSSEVQVKRILGTTLKDNHVGKAIYEDYLPQALAQGKFVPAPEALVVGKGLEKIQSALDLQKSGQSAKKVVVTL